MRRRWGIVALMLGCSSGLPADPPPDARVDAGGAVDATVAEDAGGDPDMALTPDMARPADMDPPVDMTPPADMATPADMAPPTADAGPMIDMAPPTDMAPPPVDMEPPPPVDMAPPPPADMMACDPRPEACDGVDNDCDGVIDEVPPAPCETGEPGPCAAGQTACRDGAVVCARQVMPQMEACNAVDDDCDGTTDEVPPAACETGEPGVCSAGRTACADGQARCVPAAAPGDEACDGLDNDCDGTTDEIPPVACETGRPGPCGAGLTVCADGRERCEAQISPAPESCNRLDDDCDGAIDEIRPARCDTGQLGACEEGQTQCLDGVLNCEPLVGPQPEHCDGADDDCDGRVDEAIEPRPCEADAPGACNAGETACVAGFERCEQVVAPICEAPDSDADEDCDGAVDERPDAECLPLDADYVETCLEPLGQWTGLASTVDARGIVHLSHIDPVLGPWLYTRLEGDDAVTETIDPFMTVIALDEVRDTDIVIWQGQPALCARDAIDDQLVVAFKQANAWRIELIDDEPSAGSECALYDANGRLEIAYRREGAVWHGVRRGLDNWRTERVDSNADGMLGAGLVFAGEGDRRVIAHRDAATDSLRITVRRGGRWTSSPVGLFEAAGFRPSLALDADGLWVAHGGVPNRPDVNGDVGLFLTRGPYAGPFMTSLVIAESAGGGQGVLRTGDRTQIFAREHQRHPIFGARDALVLIRDFATGDRVAIEENPANERRHRRQRFDANLDPFGVPVLSFADYREAFNGERVQDVICVLRPEDSDGDRVPDVVEVREGLDPMRADTDGDGRSDGQELLDDGTDPLVP